MLARMVSSDPRSSTFSNLKYLEKLTCLRQPQFYSTARVRAALPVKVVPINEAWRLGLLNPDRCSENRCSEDDLLAPKQRAAQSIEQDSEP